MRIILKIIAAPFVLMLTLIVAVLSFLLSLSAGVLSILASLLGILSVLIIVWEGDMQTGVAGLIMAFAISPFGLPALAIDAALTEHPADLPDFLRRMEQAGIQVKRGRGGVISFRVSGQERATRFRASTLGDGYGPEDVQAVIDGKAPTRKAEPRRGSRPAPQRVNLLIDIQERMSHGKGPAYERWAKVYNLKQMAAALQFLKENDLMEYDELAAKTEAATDRFHALAGEIQQTEAALSKVSDLMAAVVNYAKTRPVFDGYKTARYSKKFLAAHETELAGYRAAKTALGELLGGAKLPKMDTLKKSRRELTEKKKALYADYRKAQQEMRELVAVKGSVDHLRGLTDGQRNKEQTR